MHSIKNILPAHHLLLIYHSLIASHLNNGILFWWNAPKKYTNKILVLQKKAVRIISSATYNSPSKPLFKKQKLLYLNDIYELQLQRFMYRIMHDRLPPTICTLFNTHPIRNQYNTRYTATNPIPLSACRNTITHNSFLHRAPQKWSNLTATTKDAPTLHKFTSIIKSQYFSNY